jgi:hypothetical protein
MHKTIKRVGLGIALLLVAVAILLGSGWWMLQQTPDWYESPRVYTEAERAEAAKRVEQTWQNTSNWVSQVQAQQRQAIVQGRATAQEIATATSDETFEFSVSADEINAFVAKWSKLDGWESVYSQFVSEPRVGIRNGRVIIGGRLNNVPPLSGLVASVHFAPRMDEQGQLRIQLASIMGGALPVPGKVWERYRSRAENAVTARLPAIQRNSALDSYGDANQSMLAAAMGRLLLQMLNNEPIEPVLFVPVASSGGTRLIPVRIMDLKIVDGTSDSSGSISVTVRAMNLSEREDFLKRLKQPYVFGAVARAAK